MIIMERKKKIFLMSSKFMDIYRDIIHELEVQGLEVVWIQDEQIPDNPFMIKYTNNYTEENVRKYLEKVMAFWEKTLLEKPYSDSFDYFLAIDGLTVHPYLFDVLRKRNPDIRIILYLYDRVQGMYQVDRFFKYYDAVFSFDQYDVEKFGIKYLPIYWVPNTSNVEPKYDVFGFATYSMIKSERNDIFRDVKEIIQNNGLTEYIKLVYRKKVTNRILYQIKHYIKKMLGRPSIPLSDIDSGLITDTPITPVEFRKIIQNSRTVLDIQPDYQEGFTARFMWALGLGKKIITTNANVTNYPFYDSRQFFIYNESGDLVSFIERPFEMEEGNKKLIQKYRIDNWIKTILND